MNIKQEPFYHACREIIQQLMSQDNSYFFFKPVDPEADGAPDYNSVIPESMSFYRVQEKLDHQEYKTPDQFIYDVNLIWSNAKNYNLPVTLIYKTADILSNKFNTLAGSLPHVIPEEDKNNALQRLVELRFARYRLGKKTHQ